MRTLHGPLGPLHSVQHALVAIHQPHPACGKASRRPPLPQNPPAALARPEVRRGGVPVWLTASTWPLGLRDWARRPADPKALGQQGGSCWGPSSLSGPDGAPWPVDASLGAAPGLEGG